MRLGKRPGYEARQQTGYEVSLEPRPSLPRFYLVAGCEIQIWARKAWILG